MQLDDQPPTILQGAVTNGRLGVALQGAFELLAEVDGAVLDDDGANRQHQIAVGVQAAGFQVEDDPALLVQGQLAAGRSRQQLLAALQRQIGALAARLREVEAERDEARTECGKASRALAACQAERDEARSDANDYGEAAKVLTRERDALRAEILDWRAAIGYAVGDVADTATPAECRDVLVARVIAGREAVRP